MYFSNMYCYGSDHDIVGITGIVGCMGVIYKGQGTMFAVHVPDHGKADNKVGGETFFRWVRGQQQQVGKGHGELFVFINGINRPSAKDEASAIKKGLKNPPTTLCRIMKHLGSQSGTSSADSVAIMMEHVHATTENPSGAAIWYKRNGAINWIAGGKAETGQYKVKTAFQGNVIPDNLNSHWWRVSEVNCTLAKI